MELINFLLEVAGIVLPAGIMYAFQNQFPVAPLGPPFIPQTIPAEHQTLALCAIPSVIYLIGRIYFSIIFRITSKIFVKQEDTSYSIVKSALGKIGKFLTQRSFIHVAHFYFVVSLDLVTQRDQ